MTKTKEAYFAGGCFWGIEKLFKKVEGVTATDVGYIGGTKENPTYSDVTSGHTEYDANKVRLKI